MKEKQKTYYVITFGCQMNYSDSDRLDVLLENNGLSRAKSELTADLVVINSCSVRQMAEDRTYGKIAKLAKQKKRPRIVATGCLVSDKIWQKLLGKDKFDLYLPVDQMIELPKYLKKWKLIGQLSIDKYEHYLDIVPRSDQKFSAYIPIMTGCNNFCSYCAVPYTRGREVSRKKKDILKEVGKLVEDGCIELTLLGQNVNSYGNDWYGGKNKNDFVDLLKKISDRKKLKRIFFISSHPKDMSDDLIKLVVSRDNLCNYIHLPLQAGDNEILQKMNRKYTREEYLKLARKIKKWIPEVVITTDAIVGFPGETKEQFEKSVDIFRKVQFDMAYIGEYSPRPKTAASKLDDNVAREEKKRRKRVLNDVLEENNLKKNHELNGKKLTVLFNKYFKGKLIGHTEGLKQVHVEGAKKYVGELVLVKIKKGLKWGLEGRIW
ncbi:tRNA (N6-isopentenyl adenosine(37)-C2)-methylthiotransferase MiaB [Patescibacteria group bacterium]|nr:tRNA (N6-isopentenyl adenosine(37)-C2)-methylthiotransferase MiaB [Patescibacteria group bacterium]